MLAQAPPENGKLGAAGNGTELKSKPNNTATASIPDQPSVQAQHRSDALTCSPAFREYAAKINAAHHAAYGNAQKAIEKAAECGRLLIEAKAAVGHGDWLPWLAANTEISPRQCQRYMQLAERWGEVKYDAKTHLTLTDAIKAKILGLIAAQLFGVDAHATRCALAADKLELSLAARGLVGEGDLPSPWVPRGPVTCRQVLGWRASETGPWIPA